VLQVSAIYYTPDQLTGLPTPLNGGNGVYDQVTLVVSQGHDLQALIVPGGTRLVARSSPISLDASQSSAADASALTFAWTCYARNDQRRPCWTQNNAPQNTPVSACVEACVVVMCVSCRHRCSLWQPISCCQTRTRSPSQ
jgi:hypothetical protein